MNREALTTREPPSGFSRRRTHDNRRGWRDGLDDMNEAGRHSTLSRAWKSGDRDDVGGADE